MCMRFNAYFFSFPEWAYYLQHIKKQKYTSEFAGFLEVLNQ